MEIGISTDALKMCKDRNEMYKTALDLQKKFDISSFELMMQAYPTSSPSLWCWEYNSFIKEEMKDFLKNFKYKGTHLPFSNLDYFAFNPRIRAESKHQFEEAIRVSAQLGANHHVVCHLSPNLWDKKRKGELKLWRDALVDFIQLCNKYKIIFTLESAITERGIRIVKALGVKFTLDIGHANLHLALDDCKYNSIAEFIKDECELIANIHVHDNHGTSDGHLLPAGASDEHLPAGEGNIDFPNIISTLKEKGYKGPFTMEFGGEYGIRRVERGLRYIRNLL